MSFIIEVKVKDKYDNAVWRIQSDRVYDTWEDAMMASKQMTGLYYDWRVVKVDGDEDLLRRRSI